MRLRSEGRRVARCADVPGDYDVTGLSLPERVPRHAPRSGRRRIHRSRVALGGVAPARIRAGRRSRCGSTSARCRRVTHDPEGAASFDDDRQDFGGQTVEFRVQLDRRRSLARGGDSAHLRRAAGALRRTESRRSARCRRASSSRRRTRRPSGIARCASGSRTRRRSSTKIPLNGVRVSTVEIGGPYSQATGPSRREPARRSTPAAT